MTAASTDLHGALISALLFPAVKTKPYDYGIPGTANALVYSIQQEQFTGFQ
jgi:hypothetical protein